VKKVTDRVRSWLQEMAAAMREANGVGLAGPQVGLAWQVAVIDAGSGLLNLVNPHVTRSEGEVTSWEGCLSLPVMAEVTRAERVTVEALDERGQRVWLDAEGLLARALQHEIDHLGGHLITDRATRIISEEEFRALMAAEEAAAKSAGESAVESTGEAAPPPRLRVAFMGTPALAVPVLAALDGIGHAIAAVVTQPDRPRGRDRRPAPPPVKEWARERGLEVVQPASVRAPDFAAWLAGIQPDVVVTCAYGRILPPAVLAVPRLGCINVHFSLLPRHRGAAPVQWALINGDAETGVTIMHMDATMDTGDIILQDRVAIAAADDSSTLGERLASRGAALLLSVLDLLARCEAPRRPQDHGAATLAPPLDRADERIDWRKPAWRIAGLVRALSPAPGAFTTRGGETLKVWRGQAEDPPVPAPAAPDTRATAAQAAPPGTVLAAGNAGIVVACGAGAYRVVEVQAAGGRRMAASDYLRGRPLSPGERLGASDPGPEGPLRIRPD